MSLSIEERKRMLIRSEEQINVLFSDEEKEMFDRFLKTIKLSKREYIEYSYPLFYERNRKMEFDSNAIDSSKLIQHIKNIKSGFSKKEISYIKKIQDLSPRFIAAQAEAVRKEYGLYSLLEFYISWRSTLVKIYDRDITDMKLKRWIYDANERIVYIKE